MDFFVEFLFSLCSKARVLIVSLLLLAGWETAVEIATADIAWPAIYFLLMAADLLELRQLLNDFAAALS